MTVLSMPSTLLGRRSDPTLRFVGVQLFALAAPLAAGLIAYGWRALLTVGLVLAGAIVGWALWRRVGRRGTHLHLLHTLWQATLLGALLPAHLAAGSVATAEGLVTYALWPALPAAGLAVAAFNWMLGGVAGGRINPALATYLLLVVLLGPALTPHLTLRREVAVTGNLLDYKRDPLAEVATRPWAVRAPERSSDASWQTPAAQRLSTYTLGLDYPERRQITLQSLLRDRMPPMEDLIVLGQPAPIGLCSAAATLAGGLFLIFRGVADARISVLTVMLAYLTLLIAPVPAAITRDGPIWVWAAVLQPEVVGGIGWDVALTFVHYELLAGPTLFIAFFLAPLPSLRPLAGRWRMLYAALLGPLLALAQLYGSVAYGPFIALLAVSLLTPAMDRFTRARTLI